MCSVFQKSCRKWGVETSSRPPSVFWKNFILGYISIALNLVCNKNIKLHKTLYFWFRDMLNFDFLEKGMRIASPSHFAYDFLRKTHIKFVNWSNFIVWLPLLLEILANMCIAIVCFPGCDVINFEVNLIFLIKPFFYMTKMSKQKFKYLENKKCF